MDHVSCPSPAVPLRRRFEHLAANHARLTLCPPCHALGGGGGGGAKLGEWGDVNRDVWVAIKIMIIKRRGRLNEHPFMLIVLMMKGQAQHVSGPRRHKRRFVMRLFRLN